MNLYSAIKGRCDLCPINRFLDAFNRKNSGHIYIIFNIVIDII